MNTEPSSKISWIKRHPVLTGLGVFIVLGILFSGSGNDQSPSPQSNTQDSAQQVMSKEQAQKELDKVISLSKQAKLISSYEFSDRASVVYVDTAWYSQKVEFKKDLIAKISILKKAITGYGHLEFRDAYSNEKVAEVTAFSQSIEVYK